MVQPVGIVFLLMIQKSTKTKCCDSQPSLKLAFFPWLRCIYAALVVSSLITTCITHESKLHFPAGKSKLLNAL